MLARITPLLLVSSLYATAAVAAPIPGGTAFVVRDVSTADAYYSTRAAVVGLSCTAGAEGLTQNDGYWGGPAMCNGTSYYFYQAQIDVLASTAPMQAKSMATVPASATVSAMPAGTGFVVREVSTSDAYYGSPMAGLVCVASAGMSRSDGVWWSGPAVCNGTDYYFFQASFDLTGGMAPAATAPSASTSGAPIPAGTQFVVTSIHPEDAYYASRAAMEGLSCTATGELTVSIAGTPEYGGPAMCNDGSSYYFYRAGMNVTGFDAKAASGSASGSDARFTGPWLPKKTEVVIVDVSSEDAFHGLRDSIVGLTCKVRGSGLTASGASGDGWMGGPMKCAGLKLEFYQVAVQTVGY